MENKTIINDEARESITSTILNLLSGIHNVVSGKGKVIRFDYRYADTAKMLNTQIKGINNFTAEDIRRAVIKYATSPDRKYFPVSYRFGNVTGITMSPANIPCGSIGVITKFTIKDELCCVGVKMNTTDMVTIPWCSHPDEYGIGGCYALDVDGNSERLILESLSIVPKSELRCR